MPNTNLHPKQNSMPFHQVDALITQMLLDKKLTRETNGFFKLAKAQRQISLSGAVKLAVNWRILTKDFMLTTLIGVGTFTEELRKLESPDYQLIQVLQTEVQVISDDLMNLSVEFKEAAPTGPEGVHYIWWENTIAKRIYEKATEKGIPIINSLSPKSQKLIDCMVMLSKHKFGAAVLLRVAEAVAQEICLAYRAVFAQMTVDGKKLFPEVDDLAWVNSHIKAEVMHHQQVKGVDGGGMGYIATTLEEQQELLMLADKCTDAWAMAMEDFESFLKEDFVKPASKSNKNNHKWNCVVCNFVYDESKGLPDEGIAPGTRFEDIPASWDCPDCGVSKSDFVLVSDKVKAVA